MRHQHAIKNNFVADFAQTSAAIVSNAPQVATVACLRNHAENACGTGTTDGLDRRRAAANIRVARQSRDPHGRWLPISRLPVATRDVVTPLLGRTVIEIAEALAGYAPLARVTVDHAGRRRRRAGVLEGRR